MKTNMNTILFSLVFIGVSAIFVDAQSGTVKGNYCGSTYGSGAGTFAFRVGFERWDFEMEFRDKSVRRIRFDVSTVKVGQEFIIRYRTYRGSKYIKTITGTGKRRRVDPCNME